jgi:hypothetical protein
MTVKRTHSPLSTHALTREPLTHTHTVCFQLATASQQGQEDWCNWESDEPDEYSEEDTDRPEDLHPQHQVTEATAADHRRHE